MSHEKSHALILIGASGSRTAESANTRNHSKVPNPLSRKAGSGNEPKNIQWSMAVELVAAVGSNS